MLPAERGAVGQQRIRDQVAAASCCVQRAAEVDGVPQRDGRCDQGKPAGAVLLGLRRAVVQPPEHIARYNAEHWAGALYLRHLSIHLTRLLLPTGISANGVTTLMIVIGLGGAVALLIPGLVGAVVCVVAMQLQILFDCSDGEVARWRKQTSITGVYLDRVGHYLCEAALLVGFGVRGADVFHDNGSSTNWLWAFLGTLAALGAIGAKAGNAPVLKATLRVAFWGAAAMAVTAGIGSLVGAAV